MRKVCAHRLAFYHLQPADELFAELENPQGITVRSPGPLVASMVMYSANCGIVLEMDDSSGIKIEKYYKKAISYATLASILTFIQIFLLIHQMEYTPTPSVSDKDLNSFSWVLILTYQRSDSILAECFQRFILDDSYAIYNGWLSLSYPSDNWSCSPKCFHTVCHYSVFHFCSGLHFWHALFDGDLANPAT